MSVKTYLDKMFNPFLKNSILLFVAGFFCVFLPLSVSAYNFEDESGLNNLASQTGHLEIENRGESIATRISGAIMPLLGIIYLILMIYAGYLWMTASGNEDQIAKAKKIIATATVGLLVAFMSYAISIFVVSAFQKGLVQ